MDPSIFKAYDIRGLYPDQLDEEAAWKIGHATAQFLRSLLRGYERGLANAQSICVGRDMRKHSPSLAKALIRGDERRRRQRHRHRHDRHAADVFCDQSSGHLRRRTGHRQPQPRPVQRL